MSGSIPSRFGIDKLPYSQRELRVADLLDLTGVRVAVTGGGGPNLGQAIVHRFAGAGADVAVIDRDATLAASVADQAAQQWNVRARPFVADLTDAQDCRRVVGDVVETFGGIDVLVNNVGGGAGRFSTMTPADIDRIVATTLMSTLYTTSAFLPTFLERGQGVIINISSEGALMADPSIGLYNACKSAIDGFTRNLAADVGPQGVRVVAVRPGMMLGPTLVSWLEHPDERPDSVAAMLQAIERVSVGRA